MRWDIMCGVGVILCTPSSCQIAGQGGNSARVDAPQHQALKDRREGWKVKYPHLSP